MDKWQSLMDSLSPADRAAFAALGTNRVFGRGEWLIHQSARKDDVFLIVGGLVKVVGSAGGGHEVVLAFRGAGDLVGEFAAILGQPRSASVIAIGKVRARSIGAAAFHAFLRGHARVEEHIHEHITRKAAAATRHRIDIGGPDTPARLARTLARLALDHGRLEQDSRVRLVLPISKKDLAAYLDISLASLERALRRFRADGTVTTAYRSLVIADMDRLLALARTDEPAG